MSKNLTLQEQIDIVLELDAKRTPNTRAKVLCIDKEKDRIYYAMHPEETKEVDINFYTSAPRMVEIIRKQSEMLKVAKEGLSNYSSGGKHTIAAKTLATIEEMEK